MLQLRRILFKYKETCHRLITVYTYIIDVYAYIKDEFDVQGGQQLILDYYNNRKNLNQLSGIQWNWKLPLILKRNYKKNIITF